MMTKDQYIESLRKLNLNLYMFGKKVENPVDDPVIRPSLNSFAATYELAEDPQYQDLMTATSHISGKKINRFTHMHQSTDDLIKKVKMQRLLGQKTAACFQRCVGMDAMNAVFSSTYEIDEACGTKYHENFLKFLTRVQDEDLAVDGAMTDVKGDRSLAPSKQADPDLFLHVVERTADGVYVTGAKAHQTGVCSLTNTSSLQQELSSSRCTTCMTSSSFASCFMICSSTIWSPCTMIDMQETFGSVVAETVSESML